MSAASGPAPVPGPWSPLAVPTFRTLWLAILAGNIGTWVHDIAAAWVIVEQTGSPLLVAAVQSATTLPMVLLAVFAGTLADIVDRRRHLIIVQLWMLSVASVLALMSHFGMVGPGLLVAFTFALGIGAAMGMPAQQATTPELVVRSQLGAAVALGSLGVNIARSIGPALGGWIVAQWSVTAAFAVNAVSFLGILLVLLFWKRKAKVSVLAPESFGSALRAGMRYAIHATVFQSVLAKAAIFFLFASSLTALLPIVVNQGLAAGPGTYGVLLGCIGAGAILGALSLPRIRARFDPDALVLIATLTYAAGIWGFATIRSTIPLYAMAVACGFAWIAVLSTLQVAAQTAVPEWVRARAISLYITVFSAGMAIGSLAWGAVAQQSSVELALLVAAGGTFVAGVVGWRFKVGPASRLNLEPSRHWPIPETATDTDIDRGPVLVTIEYEIAEEHRGEFLALMRELGKSRRRDGAVQWGIVEETARPGVFLEYFLAGSWLEHLRQHERVTEDDRTLQERIRAMHLHDTQPLVRHFVGSGSGVPLPVPSEGRQGF
ncbi:MAG: MFS transporter [Pseudomonas sp.]|nr:MFS transporter [Pseudomonas sp.]